MRWIVFLNSRILWGLPMVILMLGTGFFLTVATKGVLFSRFSVVLSHTLKTIFQKNANLQTGAGSIRPFQAVCTALAGTVGTGNIVGVALSIAVGGPGAVFWLWISALVGMVIKYSEVTLAVAYRDRNRRGEIVGGPMYYIAKGTGSKWLALLFACFGALAAFGIGAAVQANSMSVSLQSAFRIPFAATGVIVTALGGLVLLGGIRRIAAVAEILVPLMALFYIGGAIAVLVINMAQIPSAFRMIVRDAFTGTAAAGGFMGAGMMQACRTGMSRGVFTHEAGMGSAPLAHASAATDHPARQGLWGVFEVFFDSILLCTVTALVILTSGVWKASALIPRGTLSALAFEQAFPGGQYLVTLGLALFAFATIIAWYYYGEKCVEYLFPRSDVIIQVYRFLYLAAIYMGAVTKVDAVWEWADLFNGLMALPNLITLIMLAPAVRALTRDFFRDPHRIRPTSTDYSRLMIQKDAP